jgi:putative transposase
MRPKRYVARQGRRFQRTTDSNHASRIAPNVLQRALEPTAPNLVWLADVATHRNRRRLGVPRGALDLFSCRVVG